MQRYILATLNYNRSFQFHIITNIPPAPITAFTILSYGIHQERSLKKPQR